MFKKTFAMLMALCMLVVSMPIQALADENAARAERGEEPLMRSDGTELKIGK